MSGRPAALELAEITGIVGAPSSLVVEKTLDHLDEHARRFLACASFVIVATADADGNCDASPRGDPAGFVRVIDEHTLLLPERKGNRRVDSLQNIASNPRLGLLALIPGSAETLRVNGRADVTNDATLLAACAVDGKAPALGILVQVEEVFFHCARSALRAGVWQPDRWPDRSNIASLGTIISEQLPSQNLNAAELDESLERSNRDLY